MPLVVQGLVPWQGQGVRLTVAFSAIVLEALQYCL